MRLPRLGRRADIISIALALVAVAAAGGAVLATASPARDAGVAGAGEVQIAAMRDPALAVTEPSGADAVAELAAVTGVPPAGGATARTWRVGGHGVLGYTSAGGSFCFAFSGGAGGCLQPGSLSDEKPLDVITDHGPGTFNVYGVALDGVTAVAVRVGGVSRPAALAHNAFMFSDPSFGGAAALDGEVIATMSDGAIRAVPFRIGALEIVPRGLP